jgi:hypothetical protein
MRIMASQLANRMGSIKPPDGRHTQSWKWTLEKRYRAHFPKSQRGEENTKGRGSQT